MQLMGSRRTGRIRRDIFIVLGILLAAVGLAMWAAAAEQAATKPTMLTEQDAEHIRRVLEKLSENQAKILSALDEVEAELDIVRVRVTR